MNKIKFGTARRNINPLSPMGLAGYFNIRMWERVADDIELRVLALEQNGGNAFIIQYDLVTTSHDLYTAVMAAIRAAGLEPVRTDNLIMTATHTHTAPEVRISRGAIDPAYIPAVAAKTVEALREAMAGMAEGELAGGLARDGRFLFNRRYWMKDGSVMTNPGKLNPDIRTSEGDIDPEIPLLAIRRDGQIKVLLANIVNHADTIGGSNVSGDWPGFTIRALQSRLGADAMVLPLIGCAGNINHFDVSTAAPQTQYAEAERIGKGYADTIWQALPSLKPFDAPLHTAGKTIRVSPRHPTVQEVAEAQAVMDRYPELEVVGVSGNDLNAEDLARKTPFALKYFAYHLLNTRNNREPLNYHLTGVFFGDAVVMASLPCEPFVEIGLTMRKDIFHDRLAFVVSHGNGTGSSECGGGYIPNPWNYGRGGYETTPRSNLSEPMCASKLLKAWRELAG